MSSSNLHSGSQSKSLYLSLRSNALLLRSSNPHFPSYSQLLYSSPYVSSSTSVVTLNKRSNTGDVVASIDDTDQTDLTDGTDEDDNILSPTESGSSSDYSDMETTMGFKGDAISGNIDIMNTPPSKVADRSPRVSVAPFGTGGSQLATNIHTYRQKGSKSVNSSSLKFKYTYKSLLAPLESTISSSRNSIKSFCSGSTIRQNVLKSGLLSKHDEYYMKPTVLSFPPEILDKVFDWCDQIDVVNLLHVCKYINLVACRHLYYNPQFTSTYRFAQFVSVISENPDYAQFVHVLDLSRLQPGLPENDDADEIADQPALAGWREWKYRTDPLYSAISRNLPDVPRHSHALSNKNRKYKSSTSLLHWKNPFSRNSDDPEFSDELSGNTNVLLIPREQNLVPTVTFSDYNNRDKLRNSDSFFSLRGRRSRKNRRRNHSLSTSFSKSNFKKKADPRSSSLPSLNLPEEHDNHKLVPSVSQGSPSESLFLLADKKLKTLVQSGINKYFYDEIDRWCKYVTPFELRQWARPFSTPHPLASNLLLRHASNKDVPVGHLLHVLQACSNLEYVDISCLPLAPDYAVTSLSTYEKIMYRFHDGNIYVSDVPRTYTWEDTDITAISSNDIVKLLISLKYLKHLSLCNLTWLTQSTIEDIVVNSKAAERGYLQYINASDSGMQRGLYWATRGHPADFINLFNAAREPPSRDAEDD